MNQQRVLNNFINLVSLPCPSGSERQAADEVKKQLSNLGLTVQEDDTGKKIDGNTGNILAYLKGNIESAPALLFTAHLDCVQPCEGIKPILENGVIRSSGDTVLGGDDKAGVCAILEALHILQEQQLSHGDIQIVFTVAEENGLKGSRHLSADALKADFGYALDSGGSVGEIVTMAPGQEQLDVIVHGRKAHAGVAPEEGVNAIVAAAKAIAKLRQGRIDDETTANVGIIQGGTATNIVPDRVEVRCEARSRDEEKLAQQIQHMKEIFENVTSEEGARAEVTVSKSYPSFTIPSTSPVIDIAVKAAQKINRNPKITATGGGSDANFFNSYGVPCAVLGVGMAKVHTTEEYIKEQDLYDSAAYVLAIIQTAADQGNGLKE